MRDLSLSREVSETFFIWEMYEISLFKPKLTRPVVIEVGQRLISKGIHTQRPVSKATVPCP